MQNSILMKATQLLLIEVCLCWLVFFICPSSISTVLVQFYLVVFSRIFHKTHPVHLSVWWVLCLINEEWLK